VLVMTKHLLSQHDLEEGTSPPLGTLYSLSPVELSTLWTFIDEHLNTGFICPTASSHAAPVSRTKCVWYCGHGES